MLERALWAGSILTCLVLGSAGAQAQAAAANPEAQRAPAGSRDSDRQARELFEAGRVAYDDGRFEDALRSFRAAYTMSDRAVLLFNIGMAAERARHDSEALEAFETYLVRVPDAENRDYVSTRISFLRKAQVARTSPTAAAPESPAPAPAHRPGPAAAVRDAPAADDDGPVTEKVWFWAVIGVGAAAIATTAIVLASGEEDPIQGDVGGVVSALRGGSR